MRRSRRARPGEPPRHRPSALRGCRAGGAPVPGLDCRHGGRPASRALARRARGVPAHQGADHPRRDEGARRRSHGRARHAAAGWRQGGSVDRRPHEDDRAGARRRGRHVTCSRCRSSRPSSSSRLTSASTAHALTYGTDWSTLGTFADLQVSAPLVFVGHGMVSKKFERDDLKDVDLEGQDRRHHRGPPCRRDAGEVGRALGRREPAAGRSSSAASAGLISIPNGRELFPRSFVIDQTARRVVSVPGTTAPSKIPLMFFSAAAAEPAAGRAGHDDASRRSTKPTARRSGRGRSRRRSTSSSSRRGRKARRPTSSA